LTPAANSAIGSNVNAAEFKKLQASGAPLKCDRLSQECSGKGVATKIWSQQLRATAVASVSAFAEGRAMAADDGEEIYLYCDMHAPKNAKPLQVAPLPTGAASNENPLNLSPTGMGKVQAQLSNQFGAIFRSSDYADPLNHIILQTIGASPSNPYVVDFRQFILDPDMEQFDLVEREAVRRARDGVSEGGSPVVTSATFGWTEDDENKTIQVKSGEGKLLGYFKILSVDDESITLSGDIADAATDLVLTMDGEEEATLATKDGFTDGETPRRLSKPITSDKIYTVVLAPGDTGAGIFSINAEPLTARRE
jgi:hypothetical protein